MSWRPTGGTRRAAALAAAVVSPPQVPRPSQGGVRGRHLPGLPPAVRGPGGERGGRGEAGGGVPRGPSLAPWRRLPAVVGGRFGGSGPRKPAADGGAHFFPAPLHPSGARPRAGPHQGPPLSSLPPRGAGWAGGGEAAGAGGGGSGGRSAVSGLRGSGLPSALVAPALSPTGGDARPSAAPYGRKGVPRHCPFPSPLAPIAWEGRASRHLRRPLRGACGCGGGVFRRR